MQTNDQKHIIKETLQSVSTKFLYWC